MPETPFLLRVRLRNYKSISACDVTLGNLTFLVGPNGSGKSNFLDALRFVSDAVRNSLDHAIRDRGGINEVRRRSRGHPNHFGIRLDFKLDSERGGYYAFEIAARKQGAFAVKEEECYVFDPSGTHGHYRVVEGSIVDFTPSVPPPSVPRDRLYLVNVSGFDIFRPLYDAFSRMGFYNLNPEIMRDLQTPDPGDLLARDGGNIASVL